MSTTPTNTKRKLHKCKRCGYPIYYDNNNWHMDFNSFTEELHLKYNQDICSFGYNCITEDGNFRNHALEDKSDNFKLIYDILNEDN